MRVVRRVWNWPPAAWIVNREGVGEPSIVRVRPEMGRDVDTSTASSLTVGEKGGSAHTELSV